MAEALLSPGQDIRPKLDKETGIVLVRELYGFNVKKIHELNAYDDKNYHVICEKKHENPHVKAIDEHGYVLKVLNSLDSRNDGFVEAQNEMMLYLDKRDVVCPVPVKNLQGTFYTVKKFQSSSNEGHVVRLLVYRPGTILCNVPITIDLLRDVGRFAAHLDAILSDFSHPSCEKRSCLWALSSVPKLRDFVYAIKSNDDRKTIVEIIEKFEKRVVAVIGRLDSGIIHGDLNEQNLLVDSGGTRLVAVLDFGDTHITCLIFELAIAVCYMIMQSRDVNSGKFVIEGFQSVKRLAKIEKEILKICVCARLAQSLTLGAYSHSRDPDNEYLLFTQNPGWDILKKLWPIEEKEILQIWGLEDS